MAVVKMLCGTCDAPLEDGSAACPRCGAAVALPAWASRLSAAADVSCPACGHRNTGAVEYCASCGTSLPRSRVSGPRSDERPRRVRRADRWKVLAAVGVAAVLAVLLALEVNRPGPPPAAPGGGATASMEEVRSLQAVVDADPADAAALLRLANRLHDLGLSDPALLPGAVDTYRRYLVLHPSDPNARVDLGICYFELGRNDSAGRADLFRKAVAEMRSVRTASPRHQPAAFNLGIVHLYMGDAGEAATWFRNAVEDAPESDLGRRAQNLLEQHGAPRAAR